jgi:hypothetical protein
MRRALPAISIVILILLCLFGMLLGWIKYFDYQQKEAKIASFPEYYRGLARGCYERESVNCCLSSVSNMQTKNAVLIPGNGCPGESRQEMLKCLGTYTWCEEKTDEETNLRVLPSL